MTGMEAETLAKENDDTKKGEDSIPKPTDAATAASNGEELMDDMNEETETMEENSKQRKSDALDDSERGGEKRCRARLASIQKRKRRQPRNVAKSLLSPRSKLKLFERS
jgi:hypothetical protein